MSDRMVRFYADGYEMLVEVGDAPATRIHAAFQKWLGKGNAGWEVVEDDGWSDVSTLEEIENSDYRGIRDE